MKPNFGSLNSPPFLWPLVSFSPEPFLWVSFTLAGTYSDIRDEKYRTEYDIGISEIRLKMAEFDIMSDLGFKFLLISDILFFEKAS
jgi:hypothetical protein